MRTALRDPRDNRSIPCSREHPHDSPSLGSAILIASGAALGTAFALLLVLLTICARRTRPPNAADRAAYNVGGGSRSSVNSVLETLGSLSRRRINRICREPQRADPRDPAADISRAQRELGFEPTYNFRAGLASQFKWQLIPDGTCRGLAVTSFASQ